MHADMFGLTRKPFLISPDPDACHFRNPNIDKARDDILRGLRGHSGLAVLTGPVGSGKTVLLLQLRNDLGDSPLISVAAGPEDTTTSIFHTLYEELGLDPRDAGGIPVEEALLRRLEKEGCDHGAVRVFVDDAQNLTPDALTALVRLASPDPVRSLHVQLLLCGLPDVVISLEQLNLQRFQHVVTVWARLENLRREDVAPYVRAQVEDAGGDPGAMFPAETLDRIADYTEGNPALINMLCDLCMETAQLSGITTVTVRTVDAVASSHGLSRRRGLRNLSGFTAPRDWWLRLRAKLDRAMFKVRTLRGEKPVSKKDGESKSFISRRAGERVAWGVGIVGLAVLIAVIVVPAGSGPDQPAEVVALAIPPDPQPVRILSLDEQPSADLPARPEPVAAGTRVAPDPVASKARDAAGAAAAEELRSESMRLREEIKTLYAELDLMKTREQRMGQELKLVRSERDRLLGQSRPHEAGPALQKTSQKIPAAPAPQTTPSAPGGTYLVAKGDTLWSIARRHGVTVDALTEWNGLSSGSALKPGQTIVVRKSSRATQAVTVQSVSTPVAARQYQVQRGDTLYGISRRFNVTVSDLSTWNDLQASSSLKIGQTLVVVPAAGETS